MALYKEHICSPCDLSLINLLASSSNINIYLALYVLGHSEEKKFKTLSYFLKCHLTTFSTFPHMCLFHPSGEFDSLQVMTFKYRLQGSLIGEGSYLLRMLPSSPLHNSPPRNTLNEGDCQAQTHQDHKLRGMI